MRLDALLFLGFISASFGLVIVDQVDRVQQINGRLRSKVYATAICEEGDYQSVVNLSIEDEEGHPHPVSVKCDFINRSYFIYVAGYTFDTGFLIKTYVGSARNTAVWKGSNTTESSLEGFVSPTGRTLKSAASRLCSRSDLVNLATGCVGETEVTVTSPNGMVTRFLAGNSDASAIFVAAACIAALSQGQSVTRFRSCIAGTNPETMDQTARSAEEAVNLMSRFSERLFAAEEARNDLSEQLLKQFRQLRDWADATDQRVDALNQTANLNAQYFESVSLALQRDVNQKSEEIGNLTSTIGRVALDYAAAINQTADTRSAIQADLNSKYSQAVAGIRSMADQIAASKVRKFRQMFGAEQAMLDLLATIQAMHTGEQDIRYHSNRIHRAIKEVQDETSASGITLSPFVVDEGVAPAPDPGNLPSTYAKVQVSREIVRYILPGNIGMTTKFFLLYETNYYLTNSMLAPSARRIYSLLGPGGCDASFSSTNRCQSVIVLEETECDIVSRGAFLSANATAVDSDPNTGCLTGTSRRSALDSRVIDGSKAAATVFSEISRRGLAGDTGYHVYRFQPQMTAVVPYNGAMNSTANFEFMIDPSNTTTMGNLAYYYFKSCELSYTRTRDNVDGYAEYLFGRLPSDLSQRLVLWQVLKDGTLGKGWKLSLMMYSSNLLTVGVHLPVETTSRVEVTIDGNTTVITDGTIINPLEYLLPVTDPILFDPATFDTRAWDTPNEALPISSFPGERWDSHIVALFSDRFNTTAQAWQAENPGTFPHEKAGYVAKLSEVQLESDPFSPNFGRCITAPKYSGGAWCALRDHFLVSQFGTFSDPQNPGMFVYSDRSAQLLFQFSEPGGTFRRETASGCPVVREIAQSYRQVTLRLQNPLAKELEVRMTQVGECPRQLEFTIAASSFVTKPAPSCSSAPDGQPDYIRFEYYDLEEGWVPCQSRVNLTLNGITGNVTAPISASFSAEINVYRAYSLIDSIAANQQRFAELAFKGAILINNFTIDMGFGTDNSTLSKQEELLARIRETASVSTRASTSLSEGTDYSALQQDYEARFLVLAQRVNSTKARAEASRRELLAGVNVTDERLSNFTFLKALEKISAEEWKNSLVGFLGQLTENAISLLTATGQQLDLSPMPGSCSIFCSGGSFWEDLAQLGAGGVAFILDGISSLEDSALSSVGGVFSKLKGIFTTAIVIAVLALAAYLVARYLLPQLFKRLAQKKIDGKPPLKGNSTSVRLLLSRYNRLIALSPK